MPSNNNNNNIAIKIINRIITDSLCLFNNTRDIFILYNIQNLMTFSFPSRGNFEVL